MLSSDPTLKFSDLLRSKDKNTELLLRRERVQYTYNARGAIYQLLRSLPPQKGQIVLLPAFHCPTVVEPVLRAGYQVLFYKIKMDLSIDYDDLLHKLSGDVAAVLVINYCGFPAELGPILTHRGHYDCYVIEDWAHSFLRGGTGSFGGGQGDAEIFSFYKLIPSHVGGGLKINTQDLTPRAPNRSVGFKCSVVLLKRMLEEVVENCNGSPWKAFIQFSERTRVAIKKRLSSSTVSMAPSDTFDPSVFSEGFVTSKMPWFSRAVLERSDLLAVAALRRRNFCIVNDNLKETDLIRKVFRVLPEDVCPWAYPVLVSERARYDYILREQGVPIFTFGQVLHPILYTSHPEVVKDAESLSKSLMMIPIHQDLHDSDVHSFCDRINTLFSRV